MIEFSNLPQLDWQQLDAEAAFVLLESNKCFKENRYSYLFLKPARVISADSQHDVVPALEELDQLTNDYYLAGFVAYEAAYAWLDLPMPGRHGKPLLWFGAFDKPIIFDHHSGSFVSDPPKLAVVGQSQPGHRLVEPKLRIERDTYVEKLQRLKGYIEQGYTYQVNFTSKYDFDFSGPPFAFYQDLKRKQAVAYNAFIKTDEHCVISLSPELFFRREGNRITTKPMKGTWPRGRHTAEDASHAKHLSLDGKNRSENVMIVDLMRNDLGRICETGTVRASRLFSVERYATLFQMTSTVEGQLRAGIKYSDIFKALFPSGSVTGAPKLSTMRIIRELEDCPRGIYTGAIGFTAPDGRAAFNVPIRTLTLKDTKGEMGVGSGIVYDSDPLQEYDECRLKATFLTSEYYEFSLIETMLWLDGFKRLALHMARLADSAAYFDFKIDIQAIRSELNKLAATLNSGSRFKVRLLLSRNGTFTLASEEMEPDDVSRRTVVIASQRTCSTEPFLFHKTTRRELYDDMFAKCRQDGYADVIFLNEKGQVTEGAISNIFMQRGDKLLTPPVSCGLLNGTCRREILSARRNVEERVLTIEDLKQADVIYLTNSVRGMTKVSLLPETF